LTLDWVVGRRVFVSEQEMFDTWCFVVVYTSRIWGLC
jgi:hypothetical protein